MKLIKLYDDLYNASIKKIRTEDYQIDSLIDAPNDNRFGISLVFRPPEAVKNEIQYFLECLRQVDATQYYYSGSAIHVTVLSIISCYNGFQLDQNTIPSYLDLIKRGIKEINEFDLKFKGITVSTSGIMIQGFPENEGLENLRNNVRLVFKSSEIEQSIDERYKVEAAHATVARFRSKIQKKKEFIDVLESYRNYDFGTFTVDNLELVFNDWYHRESNTKLLQNFTLKEHRGGEL